MSAHRYAVRYAQSLLDIATEMNQLDAVYNDVHELHQALTTSEDLYNLFHSPIVSGDKKMDVVAAAFPHFSPIIAKFVQLSIHKRREAHLDEFCAQFIALYHDLKKTGVASLTVSSEVSNDVVQKLKGALEQQTGKSIQVDVTVDPSLISGYILQMGDRRIDASVSRQLNDIRKQLLA
jgi:F-type H+-transporting ATPase subunit delta